MYWFIIYVIGIWNGIYVFGMLREGGREGLKICVILWKCDNIGSVGIVFDDRNENYDNVWGFVLCGVVVVVVVDIDVVVVDVCVDGISYEWNFDSYVVV